MARTTSLIVAFLLAVGCDNTQTGYDSGTDTVPEVTDTAQEEAVEDPAEDEVDLSDAPCTADGDCDDGDPCTEGSCDLDSGTCDQSATDEDGDGFPAAMVDSTDCGGSDCDDTSSDIWPGSDVPDCSVGGDNNCNGIDDEDDDEDGFIDDGCTGGDDCDDDDPDVFPGSVLVDCSDEDHDCNGFADSDNDGDGEDRDGCGGTDCDDADAAVNASATEVDCDGKDTDCDGTMSATEDSDEDGYANETCAPTGADVDCEDLNPDIHPGAPEICDEIDDDCDGVWSDGGADNDLDGVLDSSCGGTDCDDTDPDAYLGAPEICLDGIDEDCDTIADGPVLDTIPVRVGPTSGVAERVALAWTGSEYGYAWEADGSGIYQIWFVRIDEDGTAVGPQTEVTTDPASSRYPSIQWTGSEYGLTWRDTRHGGTDIYFARLDAFGVFAGSEIRVTTSASANEPDLVWTGSEHSLVYHDDKSGSYEIYMSRLDADGAPVDSETRITNNADVSRFPAVDWSGSQFGVTWRDGTSTQPDVWFGRLDDSGTKIGSDNKLTGIEGYSVYPDVAWTGSEWGLAWIDDRSSWVWQVFFARLDADGTKIGSDLQISNGVGLWSEHVALAYGGETFVVTWLDNGLGNWNVMAATLDIDGVKTSSDVLLTQSVANAYLPEVEWATSAFGMGWEDDRSALSGLYYTSIALCE